MNRVTELQQHHQNSRQCDDSYGPQDDQYDPLHKFRVHAFTSYSGVDGLDIVIVAVIVCIDGIFGRLPGRLVRRRLVHGFSRLF